MKSEHIRYTQTEAQTLVESAFSKLIDTGLEVALSINGTLCVIFSRSSGGENPIIGAYYAGDDEWIPVKWNEEGLFMGFADDDKNNLDLMLPPVEESYEESKNS